MMCNVLLNLKKIESCLVSDYHKTLKISLKIPTLHTHSCLIYYRISVIQNFPVRTFINLQMKVHEGLLHS